MLTWIKILVRIETKKKMEKLHKANHNLAFNYSSVYITQLLLLNFSCLNFNQLKLN